VTTTFFLDGAVVDISFGLERMQTAVYAALASRKRGLADASANATCTRAAPVSGSSPLRNPRAAR